MISQLTPYSVGVSAENKPLNSKELNIAPIEKLPALDGELDVNPQTLTVSGVDKNNVKYEVQANVDNVITATWMPMGGSNRVSPPDIRRGELVWIYRLADSDTFYWVTLGISDHLRRLETIIFAVNGQPTNADAAVGPNNSYWLEISTHKKLVTFSTSALNGEPFTYTLQLDTNEGRFTLTDDIENMIQLESKDKRIVVRNAANCYLELDDVDMNINVPRNFTMNVGKSADITVGKDVTTEIGNNLTETIGGDVTRTVGKNSQLTVTGNLTVGVGSAYSNTANATSTIVGNGALNLGSEAVTTMTSTTLIINNPINAAGPLVVDTTITGMNGVSTSSYTLDKHVHGNTSPPTSG